MTGRKWLFGLLLVFGGWLTLCQSEQANATTMAATECTGAFDCQILVNSGIRTNGVGILGFNRYAVLPFLFFDGNITLSGTVVVADIKIGAANFLYLYGQGLATQSGFGNGFWLNSGISQNYQSVGGIGSFSAFNIGVCNATATLAGDGAVLLPTVNGNGLTLNGGGTACSPFGTSYGPTGVVTGGITNMTAYNAMQFNAILGGGAQITLPWGDDFPDPSASGLNTAIDGDSLSTIISDLQGLGLTQQVPEPTTLALFGSALLGLGVLRRKRRTSG